MNGNLKIQQEAERQMYGNKAHKDYGVYLVVFEQIRSAVRQSVA